MFRRQRMGEGGPLRGRAATPRRPPPRRTRPRLDALAAPRSARGRVEPGGGGTSADSSGSAASFGCLAKRQYQGLRSSGTPVTGERRFWSSSSCCSPSTYFTLMSWTLPPIMVFLPTTPTLVPDLVARPVRHRSSSRGTCRASAKKIGLRQQKHVVREGVLHQHQRLRQRTPSSSGPCWRRAHSDRQESNTIVSRRERLQAQRPCGPRTPPPQIFGFSNVAAGREGRLVKRGRLAMDDEEATLGSRATSRSPPLDQLDNTRGREQRSHPGRGATTARPLPWACSSGSAPTGRTRLNCRGRRRARGRGAGSATAGLLLVANWGRSASLLAASNGEDRGLVPGLSASGR